jgi:type I site-specific restriction endonuclease
MSPSPEREARQEIDAALEAAGWAIQDRATMNPQRRTRHRGTRVQDG